jgi:aminodeoxychorismate synthase component I
VPPTGQAWARFDDLRAGTATYFPRAGHVLVATEPEQVVAVLAEAERATSAGSWAFGYVSYEAASGLDPTLPVHDPVEGLPLAWFGICAEPVSVPVVAAPRRRAYTAGPWRPGWDRAAHDGAVAAVRDRIAAGDTYQVNLTTRMTAPVHGDLAAFYADLALAQRGAYHAYLDLGRFVVAGASPELFFELRGRELRMRPMKGTAPRGPTPAEDVRLATALRASEKDRAENVMIVDLVRNDLSRVATTGSLAVAALCQLESYETVHQLTSEVTAELRPDGHLADVFGALFPCGSVTGAPKRQTMRIIRDLEPTPRGVYCGAVGVLAPPHAPFRARFNVAIRTACVDRATGTAVYGTGGGITWSSDPVDEYDELIAKTRVLPYRPARPTAALLPATAGWSRQMMAG